MPTMASSEGGFEPGASSGRRSFRPSFSTCSRKSFQRSPARGVLAGAAGFSGRAAGPPLFGSGTRGAAAGFSSSSARRTPPATNEAKATATHPNRLVILMVFLLERFLARRATLYILIFIIGAQDERINLRVLLRQLDRQLSQGLLGFRDPRRLLRAPLRRAGPQPLAAGPEPPLRPGQH